jgi:AhpC/TSA family
MLSDIRRDLCGQLGILDEPEGVALRATFIVDPQRVIRFVYVTDLNVSRDPGEVLRVLSDLPPVSENKIPSPAAPELGNVFKRNCDVGYTPITPTSSFTESALFFKAACSSGVSLISMICSMPWAPSLHGTPTNSPWMPYSPSR